MTIIKKKDLKSFKAKSDKEEIDELVDVDGSPIEGDMGPNNNTEIKTAPQQTTDDFASQAIQPNRRLGYAYGSGTRHVGENKMENLLIKLMESDLNNDGIPDIQELSNKFQKPIVANKAQEIVDSISKNNLNGEEIAILLNFIISNSNVGNIPQEYKNILRNKI